MTFSVIVPVHDEAALLPTTVPRLLEGLDGRAELVFVCNGCSDESAAILRRLARGRAQVLELAEAGKPAALRAGDGAVRAFPRVYLDADVWIEGAALNALVAAQRAGGWELVAPRLLADTSGASVPARLVSEVWIDSAHMRLGGFHCVLSVSAEGRARWGAFPDVINDDDFITARIPANRRAVFPGIVATIRPPRDFGAWVRVRERWVRGARELAGGPGAPAPVPGQGFRGILAAWPRRPVSVTFYALAVILARLRARRATGPRWYRDATSRAG